MVKSALAFAGWCRDLKICFQRAGNFTAGQFDVVITLDDLAKDLRCTLEYDAERLDAAAIRRLSAIT